MANPLTLLKLKPRALQFIQEVPVDAPPARVWETLVNVGRWWGFDPGDRPKWTLELWPGGRFLSESSDGIQMLHGLVTYIEPNKLLRMSGQMGQSHLPVMHAFIWELQPRNDGRTTLLRFGQRSHGLVDADIGKR